MKIEINVPTNLNEISLKQYQEFLKVQDGSNDEEFIAQKMVQIFCDIELKEIINMKLTSLNELILHFKNIFESKPKFQPTFKIGTQEFGFITSLEDITYGEYVDLETNLLTWETYHKAMAVMYRPIKFKFKDKYEIMDYKPMPEMQDLMKFAPVDIAISSSIFFWNLGSELLNATIIFLERQITKDPTAIANIANKLNLENSGGGINQFMRSQRETLQNLTQLPPLELINVLPISHLKNKNKKLNNGKLTK